MEQLQLLPFASISPQRELSSSRAREPYRYNSYDLLCADYQQDSFPEHPNSNTWARECSPMSTSSTISGSDDTLMPSYADPLPLPLNQLLSGSVSHPMDNGTVDATWAQQQYSDSSAWMYPMGMPALNGGGYTGYQASTAVPWNSSMTGNATYPFSHDPHVGTLQSLDDANSVKEEENAWKTEDTEDESDSTQGQPQSSRVLQLGRWAAPNHHYIPSERQFICPANNRPDRYGRRCDKAFMRIEHLRRHFRTVHHSERNHPCKVPTCARRFSRGDNLRDHYWTHIARGGRAGPNEKMSIEKLIVILGPRERKLIEKLVEKLRAYRQKQLRDKRLREMPRAML